MTTLLAVYSLKGCVGRCDYHCYSATAKRCTCICGGRNHGRGREGVSTEMDEGRIELFREGRPDLSNDELVVLNRLLIPNPRDARLHAVNLLTQLDLFEEKVA